MGAGKWKRYYLDRKKVILESFYEENKNLFLDIKIILMTLIKVVFIRDILH